jgi:prepilin-type N-terminal cleavage/methylation domain-containing protein
LVHLTPITDHTRRPHHQSCFRAFTLIELLIVVAIIAILAAIAVPNFLEAQVRAKVSREMNDLRAVATALESYAVDCNAFPPHGEVLANGTVNFPAIQGGLTTTEYLPDWPLTSPVAYMSSVLEDPFLAQNVNPIDRRYGYVGTKTMVAVMTAHGLEASALKLEPRYGAWRLYAAGPDRDRADAKQGVLYDATNGTVSNGDIVRSQRRPVEYLSADE